MKRVFYVTLLNVRLIASDRAALAWLLAMPVVFTFVVGIALSGGRSTASGPVKYALTVANLDSGPRGAELLQRIEEAGEIDLLPVEGPDAGVEAKRLVDDGDRSSALIIPHDFTDKLEQDGQAVLTFHRNPERMNPLVTKQALERAVARMNVELLAAAGVRAAHERLRGEPSDAEAQALAKRVHEFVAGSWEPAPVSVVTELVGRKTRRDLPEMGFSHSAPAMALMFVLLSGLMFSAGLVEERRARTLARLSTAPVRKGEVVLANLVWRTVVGCGQFAILILVGALVFRVDWGDSPLALALIGLTYVASVAGMSVLIGSFARTSRQAETTSLVAALSMCALGGLWWPIEITPKAYQTIGHFVPTGWAMDAMHNLVGRGYALPEIMPQASLLLGFAAAFCVAAALSFRWE